MIIEIIGLPGSGKSTLLQQIFKRRIIKRKFINWGQVKKKGTINFISRNHVLSKYNSKKFNVLKLLFSAPVAGSHLIDYILYKKIKYAPCMHESIWGKVAVAISEGVMNRNIRTSFIPAYINWELEKIMRMRISREYCRNIRKSILLDEGIITSINSLENFDRNEVYFDNQVLPDAVVFLQAEIDTVVEVSKERREKMEPSPLTNKNDEELYLIYRDKLNDYLRIVEIIRNKGIPVLMVDRNDDLNKTIDGIIQLDRYYSLE